MPNNTPPSPLCLLSDLPTRGSKGVQHDGHNLIVVRQGVQVHVYENRCPHRGIPLEWVPDQFLDNSGRLIQCAVSACCHVEGHRLQWHGQSRKQVRRL